MLTCVVNIVRTAPHLVSNNDSPSSLEAASIHGAIADEEKLIVDLKAQVKEAKSRIRHYKAALSPCRRLPPDILGEIFLRVPPRTRWDDASSYQEVARSLILVCKKWRDAAVAVPRLWSSVTITVSRSPPVIAALNAWLARSGNLPKDVVVCSQRCVVRKGPGSTVSGCRKGTIDRPCFNGNARCILANAALVEALGGMPGRCNSFTLNCYSSACAQNLERLTGSMLHSPALEGRRSALHSVGAFTLVAMEWETWPASSRFLSKLIPASVTILELRLSYTFCDVEEEDLAVQLSVPPVVLERLTALKVYPNISARHLLPTLQHCRNLESLVLNFDEGGFE